MVALGIEEVKLVFVDAKLDHFTHRPEGRMLRVRRADVIARGSCNCRMSDLYERTVRL